MGEEEFLRKLRDAVLEFNAEAAEAAAREAIKMKVDPVKAIEEGLAVGIREVGEKFHLGELFLPHIVMAADAMTAGVKILEAAIPKERLKETKVGTVVLGTVKGDLHDIGKNIVGTMLRTAGFEVHDLGYDVPCRAFIERAKEIKADIIAMSSLMTSTMHEMADLVEDLKSYGLRNQFKVIIGGGAITSAWAEEIGADGYGADAAEAVKVALKLVGRGVRE